MLGAGCVRYRIRAGFVYNTPMPATEQTFDVAALLDRSSWSTYQKLLTALAALAVIFDGFDIQVLGFAIPSLIREWHVARGDFGPVLAVGLAGMAVGGPLAGYCGDRFGRRVALIGCVVAFGLATIGTAMVHGLAGLTILRFVTGMGTGGALPNASALTAEFAPLRRRAMAVKLTLVCCITNIHNRETYKRRRRLTALAR